VVGLVDLWNGMMVAGIHGLMREVHGLECCQGIGKWLWAGGDDWWWAGVARMAGISWWCSCKGGLALQSQ
jgi:hypothetical protein